MSTDQRVRVITEVLGPRCEQQHPDCMTCVAWAMADEIERLRAALRGLMPFHPEDELGPQSRKYWSAEYRTAYEAAEAALGAVDVPAPAGDIRDQMATGAQVYGDPLQTGGKR